MKCVPLYTSIAPCRRSYALYFDAHLCVVNVLHNDGLPVGLEFSELPHSLGAHP
jgi:hypothetical protein